MFTKVQKQMTSRGERTLRVDPSQEKAIVFLKIFCKKPLPVDLLIDGQKGTR